MPSRRPDLVRPLLSITLTGILLLASLWVLHPFLLAITWATMIVVASWPLLLMLEQRMGGRRWLAASALIGALLVAIFLPFTLAIATLISNADQIISLASSLRTQVPPEVPAWLSSLPVVGGKLAQLWAQAAALGLQGLADRAAPYAGDMTRWFAARMGGLGMIVVQIMLAIAISAVLYARGEAAARACQRLAFKLGGARGEEMILLAAGAIRGVALGVGGTALIQALAGGIGLAMTGIPFISILTALMFLLCIAQIGVIPILGPAICWLYWGGHAGWGSFLLVWTLVIVNLDNFLRPWLIRRGANLPLLLILAGVIGGLISFGLVGIFLGPLLLAVTYTMITSWLNEEARILPGDGNIAAANEEAPPPATDA